MLQLPAGEQGAAGGAAQGTDGRSEEQALYSEKELLDQLVKGPLRFEDFKAGTFIYVRSQRYVCYATDYPLV